MKKTNSLQHSIATTKKHLKKPNERTEKEPCNLCRTLKLIDAKLKIKLCYLKKRNTSKGLSITIVLNMNY